MRKQQNSERSGAWCCDIFSAKYRNRKINHRCVIYLPSGFLRPVHQLLIAEVFAVTCQVLASRKPPVQRGLLGRSI